MENTKKKHPVLKTIVISVAVIFIYIISSAGIYVQDYNGRPEPEWVEAEVPESVRRGPGDLREYLNSYQKVKYDVVSMYLAGTGDSRVKLKSEENAVSIFNNLKAVEYKHALIQDNPYVAPESCYYDVKRNLASDYSYAGLRIEEKRDCRTEQHAVQQEAARIASTLSGTASEKVLQIHDYLCEINTYNSDTDMTHSAYNALLDGATCCQGYSLAFVSVCREAGIPAYYVEGEAGDGDDRGGHAWNIVQLEDGNWYELDITWDDCDGYTSYRYFCIPTSKMNRDHERIGSFRMGSYKDIIPVTYEPYPEDTSKNTGVKSVICASGSLVGRFFTPKHPIGDMDDIPDMPE